MLALKGEQAEDEVVESRQSLARLGASHVEVKRCGLDYLDPPTTVVVAERGGVTTPVEKKLPGRTMRRSERRGS